MCTYTDIVVFKSTYMLKVTRLALFSNYWHIFSWSLGSEQSAEILTANFIKVSIVSVISFKHCHVKDNSLDCLMCISNSFQGDPEKHQCETSKTGKICLHTEVSYRLLTSSYPYAKMWFYSLSLNTISCSCLRHSFFVHSFLH